ncbi:MAG: hypothetical protein ABR505_11020 [Actinomycetota bacterium]
MRLIRFVVAVAVLLGVACGESTPTDIGEGGGGRSPSGFDQPYDDVEVYPVFVSSEIVVGRNRFLVALNDSQDAPIGSPSVDVDVAFFDLSQSDTEPAFESETDFVWTIEPVVGLYVANVEFDSPGKWGAELTVRGGDVEETVRGSFEVRAEPITIGLGEKAPATDTPTADDVKKLSEISTDMHPDPSFYRLSIANAIEQEQPFVVVFATPKFCTSEVCGPTLDIVKKVAEGFPDLTFIHVEVYENLDDPSNLRPVPAVREWRLPSEPWVFVMDARGRVVAKYEGTVAPQELRPVLQKI